ncbi:acyl-homoserine lactone acylase PvdQ [Kitasatospora sp. MAA4]|uniref:penicillin acylase family protein n=1 Tax=Kitasatospora sp. MAA4 TaxID=3035093 RepID=UPI002474E98E|nr:penicillin acylase family protein [Kitasatospora sp. MAA4]MDH6133955.1 acyl-homoserine lactone acylase PvdQ [Kitasatospora sp. MAA4]
MRETEQPTVRHDTSWARRLASGLAVLCTATALAAVLPASSATAAGPGGQAVSGHGYTAQIRRTEYGVPHIQAHDFGGLGYGYGYAFAQDNLCQLADQVVTLRGDRSRYFGPTGAPSADSPGTSNLVSDTYYQSLRQGGTVQRLLDRPAPLGPTDQLRKVVDGYAAGYNRYLHDTGVANLPDANCKGKPWVGPITSQDIWNLVYDVNTNAGDAGIADLIATATPPTPAAPTTPATPATPSAPAAPAARAALKALVAPAAASSAGPELGSNAWALGRDATQNHDGTLLRYPGYTQPTQQRGFP